MLKLGDLACLPGGLRFLRKPDLESLEDPATELIFIQRNINWWLGDLVTHCEGIFGDDLWQIFPENCSLDMINRCAAMAREFPMEERVSDLSWTHHYIVKPYDKRVRRALLHKAVENRWSSDQLREHVRKTVVM